MGWHFFVYNYGMTIFKEQTIEIDQNDINSWYPMLALPCYDQSITEPTVMSLIRTAMRFREIGLKFSICTMSDSLITRARNQMVAKFMANKEFTHIMFIDCDLGFNEDDIIKLLWHDKDVATAAYPIKDINWNLVAENAKNGVTPENLLENSVRFVVNTVKDSGEVVRVDKGAIQVYDAGTGFMLIKREVIERLIERYPEMYYKDDTGALKEEEREYAYAFFNSYIDPETKRFLSEDYGFCRYLQEIDGEIWTDPSIEMTHLGRMKYKGTMLTWLEKNAKAAN
jgi:hypothetical protein